MKSWRVGLPLQGLDLSRVELVEANDLDIRDGCLIFSAAEDNPYALIVAYGPGHWAFVMPESQGGDGAADR